MKLRLNVKSVVEQIATAATVEGSKGGNFVKYDEPVMTELQTAFIKMQLDEFNTTDAKQMAAVAKKDEQFFCDLMDIALAAKCKIIWKDSVEHGRKAMIIKA